MPEIAKNTECNPEDRAEKMRSAIERSSYDMKDECVFADILTDLRHLADQFGVDFDDAVMLSEMHYDAEQEATK